VKPRVMLRLRTSLRRLDFRVRKEGQPADRAWREMLARVAAQETERRLATLEQALNNGAARRD